ncbi:MAG: NUDIX hydrolase [Magnetospiraceae bacterium]
MGSNGTKQPACTRQSGVIPYRWVGNKLEILLITSRTNGRWIVPKGVVESNMTAPASAAKEAFEEGGVDGKVGKKALGVYHYEKLGMECAVQLFSMQVTKEHSKWPESHQRKREWMGVRDAVELADDRSVSEMISALAKSLQKARQKGK